MTSYTAEGAAIKATLGWTTPQPATDAYHLDTTADAANNTTGTNTSQDYAFAVTNSGYDSIVKPFYQVTDYQYLLPGTQTNALSVHLTGGTLHGKTLSGKEIPLTKNTASLLRNGSYTLNVTLKSKDPLYLYQDGTVGYLGDQSSKRKPIAVVVQDKTASTKGLAVALKDDGRKYAVGDLSAQYYFYFIGNDNGTFNNMQGYDITYTTNYYNTGNLSYQGYSIPTVPPAEAMDPYGTPQRPLLHTYYYAAHHNPGVTVSGANVGKWFLPSSGHWRLAMIRLGNLDATKLPDDANDFYFMINNPQDWAPWDGAAAAACFTKAGGTLPLKEPYALSGTFQGVPAYIGLGDTGVFWANDSFVTNSSGYARAFVYF